MPGLLDWLDPHVDRHVLPQAGEHLVLEVRKHWAASFFPAVRFIVAAVVFVTAFAFGPPTFWVLFLLGLAVGIQALWRLVDEYRDRFVITNQRVFRVHGNLSTSRASVPLSRILDITVKKPLLGRWLDYGHFVFESAAQVQGLSVIEYVAAIDEREDVLRLAMDSGATKPVAQADDGT